MKRFALAAAGCSLALLGATPAQAAAPVGESIDYSISVDEVESFLLEQGVEQDVVDDLVESVEDGDPIGSLAGLDPIDETTTRKNDLVITTETFEDGSVEVTTLEQPILEENDDSAEPPAPSVANKHDHWVVGASFSPANHPGAFEASTVGSIKDCKVSSGSGFKSYKNCVVQRNSATANISFRASYTIVNKGNDYISTIGQAGHRCFAASCSNVKSRIIKKNESSTGKAVARASMDVTLAGGIASRSFWVQLEVGGNKAVARNGG